MQTPGVLPAGNLKYDFSPPTAAQISEAATFAEKLAAAVARERDEKDALVARAKAQVQEFLDYQAQKAEEPAAAEAAAEPAKTESSGLNALFGDNTQSALMMMLAMMSAGGGGGGGMSSLYGDSSSAQSLTGTSATTEMLMRVVPALMQLNETESRNKQNAAAVASAKEPETYLATEL